MAGHAIRKRRFGAAPARAAAPGPGAQATRRTSCPGRATAWA